MSDIYCTPTKPCIFTVAVHTLASSSAVSVDKVTKVREDRLFKHIAIQYGNSFKAANKAINIQVVLHL